MKTLFLALTLLFSLTVYSDGGSMDSGGGDLHSEDYGAAWFLGNKAVRYCIRMDPTFPVDFESSHQTFKDVISQWNAYLKKTIADDWDSNTDPSVKKLKIATDYEYQSDCEGEIDLYLYLGYEDEKIKKIKKGYSRPQAIAHRLSYDLQTGWGKGIIWLNSKNKDFYSSIDWSRHHNLHAILLHEVGHVLGNSHQKGTIMTSKIAEIIYMEYIKEAGLMIDHSMQIVPDKFDRKFEFEGLVDWFDGEAKETFRLLTGHEPKGGIHAEVAYIYEPPMQTPKVEYFIKDSVSSYKMNIEFLMDTWQSLSLNTTMFKKSIRLKDTPQHERGYVNYYQPEGSFWNGKLKASNGKEYLVRFEYNLDKDIKKASPPGQEPRRDLKYAQTPMQIFFFNDFNMRRLIGPSAYWDNKYW